MWFKTTFSCEKLNTGEQASRKSESVTILWRNKQKINPYWITSDVICSLKISEEFMWITSNSRKFPYPPHGRSLSLIFLEVGVPKAKSFIGKYQAELEFPEGLGKICWIFLGTTRQCWVYMQKFSLERLLICKFPQTWSWFLLLFCWSISTSPWMGCKSFTGLPPALNSLIPIYTCAWVERSAVSVKCPAQEHNTMCPGGAQTGTTQSGDERINHENTAPPPHEIKMNPSNFVGYAWFRFIIYYN